MLLLLLLAAAAVTVVAVASSSESSETKPSESAKTVQVLSADDAAILKCVENMPHTTVPKVLEAMKSPDRDAKLEAIAHGLEFPDPRTIELIPGLLKNVAECLREAAGLPGPTLPSAIDTNVTHVPEVTWPKFLDPFIEGSPSGMPARPSHPDRWNGNRYNYNIPVKNPKSPEQIYDEFIKSLNSCVTKEPKVLAPGIESLYAVAEAMKQAAADRAADADKVMNTFALLTGPYAVAFLAVYKAFKWIGSLFPGSDESDEDKIVRLNEILKQTLLEGFPPPSAILFHADVSTPKWLGDVAQLSLDKFRRLPDPEKEVVRQIWTIILLNIKKTPIENMLNCFVWGGWASITQVFIIARAISVNNGLNEKETFIKLYNEAGDWRSRMDLLTSANDEYLTNLDENGYARDQVVMNKVDNAGVVQWATIGRKALKILKDAGGLTIVAGDKVTPINNLISRGFPHSR